MNLALLISGGGTTAEAVINACQSGQLAGIHPRIVITSTKKAGGIQKAEKRGIPTTVVNPRSFDTPDTFGDALLSILKKNDIDIVSQNGWLPLTPQSVIESFPGKIINQHPGPLDPGREYDFGGKGMYGARVVCARIAYAWMTGTDYWIEATTHFVTNEFDKGDLVRTERVGFDDICTKFGGNGRILSPGTQDHARQNVDTQSLINATHELQKRLLTVEHRNLSATLRKFTQGNVVGYKRETELVPEKHIDSLKKAKKIAIQLFPKG
jgi:phosphoribosylglycinamide formyltransferase-1